MDDIFENAELAWNIVAVLLQRSRRDGPAEAYLTESELDEVGRGYALKLDIAGACGNLEIAIGLRALTDAERADGYWESGDNDDRA